MRIKKLVVQGVGSYSEKTSFVFVEDTITVVKGRNGSGKSTFFVEAIAWCLYGKINKDTAVTNIINDDSTDAIVKIYTHDKHKIERERRKRSQTIKLDGKIITQEKLEEFIVLDQDLFFNSVIFGQDFGGFVYLKTKDKKKFVTKLSLSFIDDYIEKITNRLKEESANLIDIEEKKERYEEKVEDLNIEELQGLFNKYNKKEKKDTSKIKKTLSELRRKIDILEVKHEESLDKVTKYQKKLRKIKADIKRIDIKVRGYEKNTASKDAEKETIEKTLKPLKKKMKKIEELSGECSLCSQKLTKKSKDKAYKAVHGEYRIAELEIQALDTVLETLHKEVKSTQNMQEEYCGDERNILSKIQKAQGVADSFEEDIDEINQEIKALKKELKKDTSNPYKKLLNKANYKFEKFEDSLNKIKKKYKSISALVKALEWSELKVREFKNNLFQTNLKNLEPVSNAFLSHLSEGKFQIEIDVSIKETKKRIIDKFDIKILHKGKARDFGALSGGERRQVALSVNMALIQLMSSQYAQDWNFVIFDEIFDGLDSVAKVKVLELLRQLQDSTKKAIIMITHDDFEKAKGVTHLEVINSQGSSRFLLNESEEF